jgi:amino acid transporter
MALRRDLPAFMARTRGENTPVWAQVVGSALTILLILANSSRATSSLFTFIVLLSTASVLVVYLAGALSAWRLGSSAGARLAIVGALLFILFAFYGAGAEANLWCLVLLAAGLTARAIMRRFNDPAHKRLEREHRYKRSQKVQLPLKQGIRAPRPVSYRLLGAPFCSALGDAVSGTLLAEP